IRTGLVIMASWKFSVSWLICTFLVQSTQAQGLPDPCQPQDGYEIFFGLREDTNPGTVVRTLNTAGSSEVVTLTMEASQYFILDPVSQELTLNRSLDADTSDDSSLTVKIKCEVDGSAPVTITVFISVADVNDNPPVFTQRNYTIQVGERASVNYSLPGAGIIRARDADSTFANNGVYYSILPGPFSDYFTFSQSLRPETLQLMKPLDYENATSMTVTILAKNMGNVELNDTAELTIEVLDEDDLNPVFTRSVYSGTVQEGSPVGTVVSITPVIQAADADKTLNAPVTYSFHDPQGLQNVFSIDPDTAQVTLVGSIDFKTVSIVVQATQKDNPSRYGVAMLVIAVEGANSTAPRFASSVYRISVSEAMPAGTTVLYVTATVKDVSAPVRYGIREAKGLFQISPQSGAVHVTGLLDYETEPTHTFTVTAAYGTMVSSATVEVTVVDANDNTPEITNTGPLFFKLDRVKGAVVTTIQAQDADAGTRLGFRLENYASLFSIDNSGTIRIAAEPADLTQSQYQLIVVVTDNGEPPREKFVTVTVTFDPVVATTAAPVVMAGPTDDTIAIALGVVAAVFLVVIIILVVFICKRRNQNSEQLDKAKANRSPDPRGLKFKNAGRMRDINFRGEMEEASDGGTTVQENPLKSGGFSNFGFVHPDDAENDRNMDEIHIETAVIPYREADSYNNNDGVYEVSSDYGDTLPAKHSLMNGLYNTSSESLDTSISNGSDGKLHLMSNGGGPITQQANKPKTWGSSGSGGGQVLQTMSM
ncbi:hypothetical protein BaRGS_00023874, partial [Batillaria attramentaria]